MNMRATPYFQTQVIGCGPGALGLAVAADRLKLLDSLLGQGIAFLEKAPNPKELFNQRFPFLIESNSIADDFFKSIDSEGAFSETCRNENSRLVFSREGRTLPLELIKAFMNDLTKAFLEKCCFSGASGIFFGREIDHLQIGEDGSVTSFNRSGAPIAKSMYAVLATGAGENLPLHAHGPGNLFHFLPSGEVLSGKFAEISREIASGKPIIILGGSHSAFSVALLILDRFGSRLSTGQIQLYHRGVCLYFTSQREASESGYFLPGAHIFRSTGEVNKFNGLRGRAKNLYQQVQSGIEMRVSVKGKNAYADFLAKAEFPALIIQATGYKTRRIGIINHMGVPIRNLHSNKNCMVDSQCRLLDSSGEILPNLFGIGIGYPRLSENKELKIGVNFFHGPDGETIVRQIVSPSKTTVSAETALASNSNLNGVPS